MIKSVFAIVCALSAGVLATLAVQASSLTTDEPLADFFSSASTLEDAVHEDPLPPSPPRILVDGKLLPNAEYVVFALPDQVLTLSAEVQGGRAQMWEGEGVFLAVGGAAAIGVRPAGQSLAWRAPASPGPTRLTLKTAEPGLGWQESAHVDVHVMVPAADVVQGNLNGYRIGRYPASATRKEVPYVAPAGYLKIDPSGPGSPVSPRFRLEDFACKQKHSGDRYLYLEPRLLPFLEAIADRVEAEGFRPAAPGLSPGKKPSPITVMSGYRTPAYNRSLGNVRLSRHMYGDAADILIDCDGDEVMDDLNRDGRVDGGDAVTLAGWIEDLWAGPPFRDRPGGLGIYNGNGSHGPFVHVDLRGKRARWGGNGLAWDDEESGPAAEAEPVTIR